MDDLETAFEQHRRELHVHCYRMLASYDDAEDHDVRTCALLRVLDLPGVLPA